jgi:hypothetical protein
MAWYTPLPSSDPPSKYFSLFLFYGGLSEILFDGESLISMFYSRSRLQGSALLRQGGQLPLHLWRLEWQEGLE